jgi:hypothetical protein
MMEDINSEQFKDIKYENFNSNKQANSKKEDKNKNKKRNNSKKIIKLLKIKVAFLIQQEKNLL